MANTEKKFSFFFHRIVFIPQPADRRSLVIQDIIIGAVSWISVPVTSDAVSSMARHRCDMGPVTPYTVRRVGYNHNEEYRYLGDTTVSTMEI